MCDASFAQKITLKGHIASVHDKSREFKCKVCDNRFALGQSLREHIITVHEGKKRLRPKRK